MAGLAQVSGWGSYIGHSSCNLRSELDFAGIMGTTTESGVREGGMVQTPTPPTKTGRKIGTAYRPVEKEVR